MSPKAVSAAVQDKLGWRFGASAEFPKAWRYFNVRAGTDAVGDDRKKTIQQYCRFDKRYESYSYAPDFVDVLVEDCAHPEAFEALTAWPPQPRDRYGLAAWLDEKMRPIPTNATSGTSNASPVALVQTFDMDAVLAEALPPPMCC